MPAQRIKGQEVSILVTTDGALEDTLTDIQDFNMEAEFEIIKVGYLGEPTDRRDMIFKGVKFDFGMHIHAAAYFTFLNQIKAKAQRKLPDLKFNISGLFAFPNGDEVSLLIPDVSFGSQPVKVGARGEYVHIKVQGECEDFQTTIS